jgi:hypothetical protein
LFGHIANGASDDHDDESNADDDVSMGSRSEDIDKKNSSEQQANGQRGNSGCAALIKDHLRILCRVQYASNGLAEPEKGAKQEPSNGSENQSDNLENKVHLTVLLTLPSPQLRDVTFRVTERRQDGPTIPLDPNAASVDPLVRASSWRIAATGRSALDSTTHQGNRNHDKAADAATDPASVERRLKG